MIPCSTSPEGGCCGQDYEQLSSILSSFPLVRALASTFLETTPTVPVCNMAFLVVSWNTCRAEPCRNFSVQGGVMVLDNGSSGARLFFKSFHEDTGNFAGTWLSASRTQSQWVVSLLHQWLRVV